MPAITKRKKATPMVNRNAILKFGKISKAQPAPSGKPAKTYDDQRGSSLLVKSSTSKRKANAIEESGVTSDGSTQLPQAPTTPRKKARCLGTLAETPTKGTRSLLQAFNISVPECSNGHSNKKQLETPPSSQESEGSEEPDHLPLQLQALVDLHSCFLTALSLHYAHNGLLSPADVRVIGPQTTRSWRARKVELEDIQKLLPLQKQRDVPCDQQVAFGLVDYGHGKICIEVADDKQYGHQQSLVNEQKLNALFRQNLQAGWQKFCEDGLWCPSPEDFLASLPHSPINKSTSLAKLATSLSKGQSRLNELKGNATNAQKDRSTNATGGPLTVASTQSGLKDPFERSANLRNRIFAKQLHQSTLPAPLTAEQIARRSALHRILEVAPVLGSMALSGQKHRNDDADEDPFRQITRNLSFSMGALVQNLQMSLRNPISNEEAARCVELLAELAPDWVTIKGVGKVVGVTIRGNGIGKGVLAMRIDAAIANEK